MFFRFITQFYIKKHTAKNLRKTGVPSTVAPIKHIGIITQKKDGLTTRDLDFILDHQNMSKAVKNHLEYTVEKTCEAHQFNRYDFHKNGRILSEKVNQFVNQSFDLLLVFGTDDVVVHYINSLSQAKFKVGFGVAAVDGYQLIIKNAVADTAQNKITLEQYLKSFKFI